MHVLNAKPHAGEAPLNSAATARQRLISAASSAREQEPPREQRPHRQRQRSPAAQRKLPWACSTAIASSAAGGEVLRPPLCQVQPPRRAAPKRGPPRLPRARVLVPWSLRKLLIQSPNVGDSGLIRLLWARAARGDASLRPLCRVVVSSHPWAELSSRYAAFVGRRASLPRSPREPIRSTASATSVLAAVRRRLALRRGVATLPRPHGRRPLSAANDQKTTAPSKRPCQKTTTPYRPSRLGFARLALLPRSLAKPPTVEKPHFARLAATRR